MNYLHKYLKYKQKYLQLKGGNFCVPQEIMNKELIINLVNKYPEEINRQFTSQYALLPLYHIPEQVENYKNMIIDLFKKIIEGIKSYQAEDIFTPITIVTVGNTPYKITRLIELFGDIKNINFIYLPFSGSFNKIKKECTCGTIDYFDRELKKNPTFEGIFPPNSERNHRSCTIVNSTIKGKVYSLCHWKYCELLNPGDINFNPIRADKKYMETFLSNPEEILNQQYKPIQRQYFENMLINSGLKKNIDDNHKIILIDYLEKGYGLLSFLMTIDKYLKKCNTLVLGLVYEHLPVYNEWKGSQLINSELILNKYKIKYIGVDLDPQGNYKFLLFDTETNDRCVKSYKKNKWINNYTNYSEQNINNCNIALLNMALILKNNKIIQM
jgi:hypothetical protein